MSFDCLVWLIYDVVLCMGEKKVFVVCVFLIKLFVIMWSELFLVFIGFLNYWILRWLFGVSFFIFVVEFIGWKLLKCLKIKKVKSK